MKLSDYVIDFLVNKGIQHVFEMTGGGITHLLDSVYSREDIECVSVHHEQAGAFAAEAYARINGNLGVAMATSGPGALNLVTGIGSCYFDSVPCLFITGQVNTYEYKFDRPIRQIGFQETDIVSVVKPITKYAEMILDANRIRFFLEKAVYSAQEGRPGPVVLDIPMNIQRAEIDPENQISFFDSEEYRQLLKEEQNSFSIDEVLNILKEAKRPIILAGGGIRTSNASNELNELVQKTNIPVVASLMGIDSINHEEDSYIGMIGSYGNRYSNLALANSDFILILGSRLDSRQTGTRPDTFGRAARKIHVDIDNNELNAKVNVDLTIRMDVNKFLQKLNSVLDRGWQGQDLTNWYDILVSYKEKYPTTNYSKEYIDPNWFMEELSEQFTSEDTVSLDVGQHQMWASQSLKLKKGQRLLNSGGMGSMGFALPAAIGAYLAKSKGRSIVIAGDGGIQVNIQELDTIVALRLPIVIIIMNNQSLGMVRQFQDLYFDKRRQSTVISKPNFFEIAKAYGLDAYEINDIEKVSTILSQAFVNKGPVLVNVKISMDAIVNPKLVVNKPIEDMSPHLPREELKKAMLIDLVEDMEIPK